MNLILPILCSFVITLISIPLTIKLAYKFNLIDDPQKRSHPAHVQNRVVPRAGGLACYIGLLAAILIFLPLEKHILGIMVGITILTIQGLLDDRFIISPYLRLAGQIVAAVAVVMSGIGISFLTNPFGGLIRLDSIIFSLDFLGTHKIILIADLLAIIWIVWVMNMINWSKGVDGQMPGIVTIAALTLGLLSLKLYFGGDSGQLSIAQLAFISTGASLALLIFNWYPAKIFPGFSGSTIFGFLVATLAILSGAKLATAGLVLLVPATDFIYTFLRRLLQGKSPVWGDRGHLHHKLLDLGLTHQQIALFYIMGSVILGAASLSLDSRGKLYAALLVGLSILGVILWLNFFGGLSEPSDQDNG